ncbi:MAG: MFS transporter [Candidatus Lokiarchaeota archaeon]|nr:MFS transporter [Candidatus Lokiarchaeota archaeon]
MEKIYKERVLDKKHAFLYSLAAFGLMVPVSLFNGFSYYYMVYIVGLRPILASIGNSLGLLLNAFTATIAGYLSDKHDPSKFGRRRPFLLIGTPIMVLGFFFLWFWPEQIRPDNFGQFGVAIIYWISIAVFCIFSTYVFAPYQSMLPEISSEKENRIEIASMQGIANLFGTIIGMIFPFIIKSFVTDTNELIFYMELVSIVTCVFSVVTIYITFATIHEPIEEIVQERKISDEKVEELIKPDLTLKETFVKMFTPLKNRNFRNWELSYFFFNLGMRIPMTVVMPVIEIVLGIVGSELFICILIILPFAGLGFYLWTTLSKKKGLVESLEIDFIILIGFMLIAAIFLIPMSELLKKVLGVVIICIIIAALIAIYIIPNPIISEIIDEEIAFIIEKNGQFESEEQKYEFSGKFFGVNSFILNLAQAISFLILGPILEQNEENPTFITICLPITAIIVIIALIFLKKVKLKKE